MRHFVLLTLLLATFGTVTAHAEGIDLSADFDRATSVLPSSPFANVISTAINQDQWDGAPGFPPIVRQSPLGACQSFAFTAMMEYAYYRRFGAVADFSEKGAAYNLIRYMIDEFYDPVTGTYPEHGALSGRPELGSGIAAFMIDSLLKTGISPAAGYSFGNLEAKDGALQLDLDLYFSTFENGKAALPRAEYLDRLDRAFLSPPPANIQFNVPYFDFAKGEAATKLLRTPLEVLDFLGINKSSFHVYHNQDMAPFYKPEWKPYTKEIVSFFAEETKKKGIAEDTLPAAELQEKILSALRNHRVVMVAAQVWKGSWSDPGLVYELGGGHAMVIVGFQQQGEKIFFKLRNSWGTAIGIDGYDFLESTVLLPNLMEATVLEN